MRQAENSRFKKQATEILHDLCATVKEHDIKKRFLSGKLFAILAAQSVMIPQYRDEKSARSLIADLDICLRYGISGEPYCAVKDRIFEILDEVAHYVPSTKEMVSSVKFARHKQENKGILPPLYSEELGPFPDQK